MAAMAVCRWSRPATSIHDRAQWVHDHLPNFGDGACCDPRCLRRTHVSGRRIRRRWGRLATTALDLAAPFGCSRRASARVAAPSRHDVDPRPSGAPDGERDRRPGPCAADGCWQRAGRLGACASLLGDSGHRDYLRAGTAAHGPRNSQIRLRPRGAERQAPCGHGRASVARCCRAFGVLDLIFECMFFHERDRWRVLRRAEAHERADGTHKPLCLTQSKMVCRAQHQACLDRQIRVSALTTP